MIKSATIESFLRLLQFFIMINIGKINTLKISKQNSSGIFLSDNTGKQVLLADKRPKKYELDDSVDAFVFVDGDGHLAAFSHKPFAQVDEIAYLKVVTVNYYGAFLDWGLSKDLLVPFSEQHHELEVGESYFFKLFLDDKNRIVATTKIAQFLSDEIDDGTFIVGQPVNLVIAEKTDLGIKAIVDNTYWGVLYENEIFQPLRKGQKISGFIKYIRDDLRLDLTLHEVGYAKVTSLTNKILQMLQENGGELAVSDKSEPEQIYALFHVSKKVFKQAIGSLYKEKKIDIEKTKIRVIDDKDNT
jgi:predicted RNA-binding protein (virulence factor B family)